MSKLTPGGATLLAAPLLALVYVLAAPTASDEAADRLNALTSHRGTEIAALALGTVAIALFVGGTVWLAARLTAHAPRLAVVGGILGVTGALVILFEDGLAAAGPSVVAALDPAQAKTALEAIEQSAAVSALEPLSIVMDVGLALLAIVSVRAGVARWAAAAVAVGGFAETAGFATGTRALQAIGFALLLVGLTATVRVLVRGTAAAPAAAPATAR